MIFLYATGAQNMKNVFRLLVTVAISVSLSQRLKSLLQHEQMCDIVTLHRFYAVASIKSGDDIKTVQENLGHATAAFTLDVYGHVTEKMKRESAARMEAFIQAVNA